MLFSADSQTHSIDNIDWTSEGKGEDKEQKSTESSSNAGRDYFKENIFNFYQSKGDEKAKEHIFDKDSGSRIGGRFGRQHLREVDTLIEIQAIDESIGFLVPDEILEEGKEILLENNVLFLTGNSRGGTREIALHLAGEIYELRELNKIRIASYLGQQTRINLSQDIAKEFSQELIILKDAASGKNADVLEYINRLNASTKFAEDDPLFPNLKKEHTFLIITLNEEEITNFRHFLNLPFVLKIKAPDTNRLAQYLTFELNGLSQEEGLSEQQKNFIQSLDKQWIQQASSKFEHLDNVNMFIQQLKALLKGSPETLPSRSELEAIMLNITNLKNWLINSLSEDFDTWTFILSLGLLHSKPESSNNPVSLMEFQLLRKELTVFLQGLKGLRTRNLSWKKLQPESSLLHLCRAKKEKDEISGEFYLKFNEEIYSTKIWETLQTDLSLSLIQLVPFLLGLIENNPNLAPTAARILGRIGEMDIIQTHKWMHNWASSNKIYIRVLVGYLFKGIHASNNPRYIDLCEKELESLGESSDFNKIWSAIAAYKQIGLYRLEYALDQMADIVERWLSEQYTTIETLRQKHRWEEGKQNHMMLYNSLKEDQLYELFISIFKGSALKHQIEEFGEKLKWNDEVFFAVTYSISALAIMLDPFTVLNAWLLWLNRKDKPIKVFLLKMLIPKGGVLSQLRNSISIYDEKSSQWENWHIMLYTIHHTAQEPENFLTFFQKIANAFQELPPTENNAFKELLWEHHLKGWMSASENQEEAKESLIDLIASIVLTIPIFTNLYSHKIENID